MTDFSKIIPLKYYANWRIFRCGNTTKPILSTVLHFSWLKFKSQILLVRILSSQNLVGTRHYKEWWEGTLSSEKLYFAWRWFINRNASNIFIFFNMFSKFYYVNSQQMLQSCCYSNYFGITFQFMHLCSQFRLDHIWQGREVCLHVVSFFPFFFGVETGENTLQYHNNNVSEDL